MDLNGTARTRYKKPSSTQRFLGSFPCASPDKATASTTSSSAPADELNEDDVFWSADFSAVEPNHHHNPNPTSTSPSSTPRHLHHNRHSHTTLNHHHLHKGFAQPESFGILAALPENETSSPNLRNSSHFYHKASVSSSSSSSSSSSRMIPVIPKPPQERINPAPSSSVKYHQSAPLNIPVLSQAIRRHRDFFVEEKDEEDGEAEMLPPHEIVARGSAAAQSPMLACSVLEGVGRTLKGRDLRQVRNAVWRQTGFLD
ncbi:protein S40-7 [Ziziphus jujuba]|uniref:Protein S40-7 n=1 Tax=Ziziphus jujuba TaxID=326968 RepID=A0A6P3Z746_ZIZJJ|nr:protein S40-7 [Ziziphus jujuba]